MGDTDKEVGSTPVAVSKKAAPEVTPVTMEDGRVVEFTGKVQMYKEIVIVEGRPGVRFDFRSGLTGTFLVPEALVPYSAGHGYSQKLGDEVAGLKDKDGQPASAEDKMLAIEALHQRIAESGDWNKGATGGGGVSGASLIIKALMEASGKSLEEIKAFIESKLKKAEAAGQKLTRAALYQSFRNPASKVGQIIDRLEREKIAKAPAVDSDETLAELRGE